ncbi:ATP-grasp domain-containing protein [Methyloversatilis discipulorum]|uniref:ATP-grasp domain-containing protein n=1 Tax=Methyloversatilis discipulorum TaxID=1119528 RepID=UPI001A3637FA|nr:ATP-grasp domain-containing protein [Methyloversatilis discipulorum]MBL8469206.1 ATP-grasp domain-containing protein [Methyloversatilis discipulorum]
MPARPRTGLLFAYDWDRIGFAHSGADHAFDHAGFDLFSFPSSLRLIGFDLERFAERTAERGRRRDWSAVISHHEAFGALAAALVAERLGLPCAPPEAILAAQHKLHARRVLEAVAPEACLRFAALDMVCGDDVPARLPAGFAYPVYAKPIKAAFSVLAREVHSRDALQAHTRFDLAERWIIRRLIEPFDRVCRARLPEAGSAHRMLLEEPVDPATPQFNLDGWVFDGQVHALGVVDAIMHPGTQAFMRWELPSRLPASVQARALDVARRFLGAIGYDHGFFNLEFFYDDARDRLTVIECNPRLASQFSDLYLRVHGIDAHAWSLALAHGEDPRLLRREAPRACVAASLVYRAFDEDEVPAMPDAARRTRFAEAFPEGLLFAFGRNGRALRRDLKWTGSHRYGIVHLDGTDAAELRARAETASDLLGWRAPYRDDAVEATPAALDVA